MNTEAGTGRGGHSPTASSPRSWKRQDGAFPRVSEGAQPCPHLDLDFWP